MPKTAKRIALAFVLFMLIVFVIFVVNQTMQIAQSARAVSPLFGTSVMWALIFVYIVLLITRRSCSGSDCLSGCYRQ